MAAGLSTSTIPSAWRQRAARVVEELFPQTPSQAWDDLLDLRQAILRETHWPRTLDHFLRCRQKYEKDHYLPFYRLRKLLENHLRLAGPALGGAPQRLHLWKHRCFADLWRRAHAQHARTLGQAAVRLEVVEA